MKRLTALIAVALFLVTPFAWGSGGEGPVSPIPFVGPGYFYCDAIGICNFVSITDLTGQGLIIVDSLEATTINAGILRVEKPATGNLSAQEMRGTLLTNYGQTVANTQTCPTLTGELNGIVQIETAGAGEFYLKAGPNDRIGISVGGTITWLADGNKVGFAIPAVGNSFSFKTIRVGVSAYDMIVYPNEGALVDGGA